MSTVALSYDMRQRPTQQLQALVDMARHGEFDKVVALLHINCPRDIAAVTTATPAVPFAVWCISTMKPVALTVAAIKATCQHAGADFLTAREMRFIPDSKLARGLNIPMAAHLPMALVANMSAKTLSSWYGPVAIALLDAGAELNPVFPNGVSALHLATAFGSTELAAIMIARGASPFETFHTDLSPFWSHTSCSDMLTMDWRWINSSERLLFTCLFGEPTRSSSARATFAALSAAPAVRRTDVGIVPKLLLGVQCATCGKFTMDVSTDDDSLPLCYRCRSDGAWFTTAAEAIDLSDDIVVKLLSLMGCSPHGRTELPLFVSVFLHKWRFAVTRVMLAAQRREDTPLAVLPPELIFEIIRAATLLQVNAMDMPRAVGLL